MMPPFLTQIETSSLRGDAFAPRTLYTNGFLTVVFPEGVENRFEWAYINSANFWSEVITKHPLKPFVVKGSPYDVSVAAPGCNADWQFDVGTTINSLVIFVVLEEIDGPGQNGFDIYAQANVCVTETVNGKPIPRFGFVRMDTYNLEYVAQYGILENLVKHEMGHALGVGTLWGSDNLVENPCFSNPCTTDPRYTGKYGVEGWHQMGLNGQPPVENVGNFGTINIHWRESVFQNELMTGYVNSGYSPLTKASVLSLKDLGYKVNANKAEYLWIDPTIPTTKADSDIKFALFSDIAEVKMISMEDSYKNVKAWNDLKTYGIIFVATFSFIIIFAKAKVQANNLPIQVAM